MPTSYEAINKAMTNLLALGGLVFVFAVLICVLLALIIHYIEAIPTYIIAKKNGYRHAWVALLPSTFCSAFVLSAIPGKRDVKLIGRFSMKNVTAFITYIFIAILGPALIGIVSKILLPIPVLGVLLATLARLVPAIACTIIEYAFLRDVIDIYSTDKKSNIITSIIVVIANRFIVIVRAIYLWTLVGRTPESQPIVAEFTEE